jgi:alkanesulfonate monooxygenase
VPEGDLRSSWANASTIATRAEELGFRNILCPSSYQVGQDTLSFVAGMAPKTSRMNMLAAIRCGEMHPAMLARTVATLDHMLEGRLTLNVISSDFPGQQEDSAYRYRRSWEVVEILKQAWTQDEINYQGQIYNLKGLSTDPVRPYQTNGPLLYFGGYSPDALALCGAHCAIPRPKPANTRGSWYPSLMMKRGVKSENARWTPLAWVWPCKAPTVTALMRKAI